MSSLNKFVLQQKIKPRKGFGHRRFIFNRLKLRRGLEILPNLFTLGNAFFGFCSVIFASYGDFVAAAYFILLGALMDALDGRIARYACVTSELGMQLDSLCDAVSFCFAPAVLIYLWQLKKMGALGLVACALFLMAGLLRLAKFNLTHTEQSTNFSGIPSTLAGCFLATVMLNMRMFVFKPSSTTMLMGLMLILAALMVSSIPFPSFKKMSVKIVRRAVVIFAAFIVTMGFTKVLLLLFIAYFTGTLGLFFYHKAKP